MIIRVLILCKILSLQDDANYLIRPKVLVRTAVEVLKKKEKRELIKRDLASIL